MANKELIDILRQGGEKWNQWVDANRSVLLQFGGVKLHGVDLDGVDLSGAKLSESDLYNASFKGAILRNASFYRTHLLQATFRNADLQEANLYRADLQAADLRGVNLTGADLSCANLTEANLEGAILRNVNLGVANLNSTRLTGAILSDATIGWTVFANTDLSAVVGLDALKHKGPSTIGIDTLYRSGGNLPEVFMQRAGVPESFLQYAQSLVGTAIDYYSAFISHSSKDEILARRLYDDLLSAGIRCWIAWEDLRIGDKIWQGIDQAIMLHDKLLLILSKHSISSEWVEREVEAALAREREQHSLVLFPIRVDDSVMNSSAPWAAHIRRTRHIGDFRNWEARGEYKKALQRLLQDLRTDIGNSSEYGA